MPPTAMNTKIEQWLHRNEPLLAFLAQYKTLLNKQRGFNLVHQRFVLKCATVQLNWQQYQLLAGGPYMQLHL